MKKWEKKATDFLNKDYMQDFENSKKTLKNLYTEMKDIKNKSYHKEMIKKINYITHLYHKFY